MNLTAFRLVLLLASICAAGACTGQPEADLGPSETIRIATYNIEDVRTDDLLTSNHPRLERIAAVISEIDPDIILLNEIAYDFGDNRGPGANAQAFADDYLSAATGKRYTAFVPSSNTGIPSGFDLDRNGDTLVAPPDIPRSTLEGPGGQTPKGRAYGGDAWGFGMFPGQYGMALLVSNEFEILKDDVRSFQTFKWADLPEANRPIDPDTGEPWYSDAAWKQFPLSSKTHVDIPVEVRPGTVVHVLASHPTPPAFDGPEQRNKLRNHDEIRFWRHYLDGAPFVVDDSGDAAGLEAPAHFVIAGDLNADPDEGSSYQNPIKDFLFSHPRVNASFVPRSETPVNELDPDDTAAWGLRVDYVLPSRTMRVVDGGVQRYAELDSPPPSDHYPVWIDVQIPALP